MRRHELDVFSLVAGLVFVAVAAGHIVDESFGPDFDSRWVLPVGMVAIGVAGLASLTGRERGRVPAVEHAEDRPVGEPAAEEPTTPGESTEASADAGAGPSAGPDDPATESTRPIER